MILALTFTLILGQSVDATVAVFPVPTAIDNTELDAKIAAAGKDVAKLLELAAACASSGQEDAAKRIYKKVVELDANNETARTGLRHQRYDGKWFESFAELAKYKREEAARMKLKGLVRFKEDWVAEADLPFLNMGWVRDTKGAWAHPAEIAALQDEEKKKADGFRFRADDNSWIAPADDAKWAALLWKCGDEWVDLEKANAYHSSLEHTWELAGDHFIVSTTCDWEAGNLARWHAEKAYAELVRLLGVEPRSKLSFVVLKNLEQYNQASGNQPIFPESEGFSSLHGAYFSDALFDTTAKPPRFLGCGVSYWDRKDEKLARWGPLWARFAAAQSFIDAVDPSWAAVGEWVANAGKLDGAKFAASFWAEKKLPRWLRYGAASYVERYMKDPLAAEGTDPWTLRAFAFDELKKAGKLSKLDDIIEFKLDLNDVQRSTKLYEEAGLLVSFLLDGAPNDKELAKDLKDFQVAFKSGEKAAVSAAVTALQKALAKHERDIKKFAGL